MLFKIHNSQLQLQLIKTATDQRGSKNIVILGDFNLNENMKFSNEYSHKSYYDELNDKFDPLGLIQLVEFETWRRLVNGQWRTSILDHVYTDDVTIITEIAPVDTIIGDHSMVTVILNNEEKMPSTISYRRDWTKYSKTNYTCPELGLNLGL